MPSIVWSEVPMTRGAKEAQLQMAVVQWLNLLPEVKSEELVFFHPANGEARNSRTGRKLKLMGVKPGVSDLAFVWGGGVGFIELKTARGRDKLSGTQKRFISAVVALGAKAAVCHSADEVAQTLRRWEAIVHTGTGE